jgi:Lysyl oxidase
MRPPQRRRVVPVLSAGLVAIGTVLGVGAAGGPAFAGPSAAAGVTTAAAATTPGPVIKLIVAQRSVTVQRFGKQADVDPGVWVAAIGAPLRLNVGRASYTKPVTITQVIAGRRGATRDRRLPRWTAAGWNGLRDFARLTIRTTAGKVVGSRKITFCPDSYDPERTGPASATTSRYPTQCGAGDPFPRGTVWGLARGWAVDPAEDGNSVYTISLGTYHATETIFPAYRRIFHIPWRDSHATVTLHVVKGTGCCAFGVRGQPPAAGRPLPSLPQVRTLSHPPASALPDLVALPSWGISTSTVKKTKQDFLNFGATVWVGGSSRLDVEGFRQAGSPIMHAYQYFWKNGRIVGRVRAGTMGFDSEKGHNHWHFQQFARYQLLNASRKVAVRSEKVGFCIAPTDAVDLLLQHATWQPTFVGLGGQCGSPTALWVQEMMPIGWGDTYDQYKAGQAFNITKLASGTYYVEIIANPEHVLHEVTRANDISLRKVIIGGTPGHRTVRVPAWHGINPEK